MFQHKYKKHKKNPKSPMSMKSQMTYLPSLDKLDSPKSVYLSDDQASCSSQTTTMSAPPSPHTDSYPPPAIGVNILKAVLTGSQEVRISIETKKSKKNSRSGAAPVSTKTGW